LIENVSGSLHSARNCSPTADEIFIWTHLEAESNQSITWCVVTVSFWSLELRTRHDLRSK